MRYGLILKSGESLTVYYEKDIGNLQQELEKAKWISFDLCGTTTFQAGEEEKAVFTKNLLLSNSIESIYYEEKE